MRLPICGGNWNNGGNAGLAALNLNNPRSITNSNVSFRPALEASQKRRQPRLRRQCTSQKGAWSSATSRNMKRHGRVVGAPKLDRSRFAMKTYNNLFPQVYDFEALHNAYLRARRGKRHRHEVLCFERDLEGELIHLQNELIWGEYQTGPYRRFYVYEPKKRLAAALPFRDRVVQHSLVAAIETIWEARFIHHSYACRPGRGMHAGANQAQQWLRQVQAEHGRVYVLKADVAQYFASIDHEVMKGLLRRRIACRPTLALCEAIIDTWAPGLPIGNLTSQLWANVYLHELDLFAKHELRALRYMRYMDDFVLVHHDKAQLHFWRREITDWLRATLRLELNQKTQIFPVARCRGRALDFLGYRMWPTHRRLRKDSVKRMQRRLRAMQKDYARGRIEYASVRTRLASWIAHANHADTYRIRSKLLGNTRFQRNAAPAAGDQT